MENILGWIGGRWNPVDNHEESFVGITNGEAEKALAKLSSTDTAVVEDVTTEEMAWLGDDRWLVIKSKDDYKNDEILRLSKEETTNSRRGDRTTMLEQIEKASFIHF